MVKARLKSELVEGVNALKDAGVVSGATMRKFKKDLLCVEMEARSKRTKHRSKSTSSSS